MSHLQYCSFSIFQLAGIKVLCMSMSFKVLCSKYSQILQMFVIPNHNIIKKTAYVNSTLPAVLAEKSAALKNGKGMC